MIIVSKRLLNLAARILSPGKQLTGLAIFPFIIIRDKESKNNKILMNHERIHLRQQIEMLVLPFYILYFIELWTKSYYRISFEREAYDNEDNPNYLKERKFFSFLKYF